MLTEYFLKPTKEYKGYITNIDYKTSNYQAYINPHLTEIYLRINNRIYKKQTSIFLHPSYSINQVNNTLNNLYIFIFIFHLIYSLQVTLTPNSLYFRRSNLLDPETIYNPNGIQYNSIIIDFSNKNNTNKIDLQIQQKYDIKIDNFWYVGILLSINDDDNSLIFHCTYDRKQYKLYI